MPPLEPRQIKRPRLSLSCIVCRRRKVRCGREHPECANCVRMKKNCIYKAMVRDDVTDQVHHHDYLVPPDFNGPKPHTRPLTWSHWEPAETDNTINTRDEPPPGAASSSNHEQGVTPSLEETIQLPDDHRRRARSGTSSSMLASTPASANHRDGYLSLRRGSRARYIGQCFWGFVAGKVSEV